MMKSYWHKISPPLKSNQTIPATTDIAIIGGGLIGCSIAYQLSQAGVDCVLFEENDIAHGASGRNDGQIILETMEFYHRMIETYGREKAKGILDFKRLGQLDLDQFIRQTCDPESIDYHQAGSLTLAINDQEAIEIKQAAKKMSEDGFASEIWDQQTIADKAASPIFPNGKFDPIDSVVNPVALCRHIASQAQKNGVIISQNTPVTQLDETTLSYAGGQLEAGMVILATNAYTARLLPELSDWIYPIRGQVLITEPLQYLLGEIPPYACITNYGYEYWHVLPDGRVMLGGKRYTDEEGEKGLEEIANPVVHQALDDFLMTLYPQLKTLPKIEHRWSGIMGFSRDGLPIVGPMPGNTTTWIAAGFTGYGLGMCWSIGKAVADALTENKSPYIDILNICNPRRLLTV